LKQENVETLSSFLEVMVVCDDPQSCVAVNHTNALVQFTKNSETLFKKTKRSLDKFKRCQKGTKRSNKLLSRLRQEAVELHAENVAQTSLMPEYSNQCVE